MTIFSIIADIEKEGKPGVYCVVVASQGSTPRHAGSKMVVFSNGTIQGSVGGGEIEKRVIQEALDSLKDHKSRLLHYALNDPGLGDPGVCGGQVTIYVEPLTKPAEMIIIGAGHVGKAVARLAKWLGFRVAISDDRTELCSSEQFPDADDYFPGPITVLTSSFSFSSDTVIVLTTRGSDVDVINLPYLVEKPFGYMGIIGSRKRWLTTRAALLAQGVSEEKLNLIRSPIGLELNAETPEEIAVSILAEIIMLQKHGSGLPMSR